MPGEKITSEVSRTRMIPEGADAISPAPHHDIYSIEDLRQLIFSVKEATCYEKRSPSRSRQFTTPPPSRAAWHARRRRHRGRRVPRRDGRGA